MAIRVVMVTYKDNPAATFWSRLGTVLEYMSPIVGFALAIGGSLSIKNGFLRVLWIFLSICAAIVYFILVASFCNRMVQKRLGERQEGKRSWPLLMASVSLALFTVWLGVWQWNDAGHVDMPADIGSISIGEIGEAEYYCGEVEVLKGLGQYQLNNFRAVYDFYLAAFRDKDGVWNYCILDPGYRKTADVGSVYSGCFKVSTSKNNKIIGWKSEAVEEYDSENFSGSTVVRNETDYILDYRYESGQEYLEAKQNDKGIHILGALFLIACGGLFLYMGCALFFSRDASGNHEGKIETRHNSSNNIKSNVVSGYEGKSYLLFEDTGNPYESIYIKANISQGRLTLMDEECDHDPDGGWSHSLIQFDEENTKRVFSFLSKNGEPVGVLKRMINSQDRLRIFLAECKKREIQFTQKMIV